MIVYDKALALFKERGITSYTVKRDKVIGQESWKKLQHGGGIDTRTLNALCKYLNCQPGDLLEYRPDDEGEALKSEGE